MGINRMSYKVLTGTSNRAEMGNKEQFSYWSSVLPCRVVLGSLQEIGQGWIGR